MDALTKAEIHQLVGRGDPVILEIGCNDGRDTAEFLVEFPGARLYAFEPDPRPLERFNTYVRADDPRVQLEQCAIGDKDGQTQFYPSGGVPPKWPEKFEDVKDWDLSGSIRKPTHHLTHHTWCTFGPPITVPIRRLDSWLAEHPEIELIDFIWADVQGAEVDLIRGGREALARTRYLYTEYYDRPMYEGQIDHWHLVRLLPNFTILKIYPADILLQNAQYGKAT